eukprot:m.51303 g.51303  ORF g.51303 m.51303 type:complete len:1147 (-) comp6600_c1_seq2:545-3985(-)
MDFHENGPQRPAAEPRALPRPLHRFNFAAAETSTDDDLYAEVSEPTSPSIPKIEEPLSPTAIVVTEEEAPVQMSIEVTEAGNLHETRAVSKVAPPQGCYSPTCPCRKQGVLGGDKNGHRCYSTLCLKHRPFSYWRCRSIRRLLVRAHIICTLKGQQFIPPFASFVPRNLHNYLMKLAMSNQAELPFGTTKPGSVLFADASGFTALTERLAKKPNGAEELCSILNSFFSILVKIVHQFGGDIVKFAGDAVSIVWFIDESDHDAPADLQEAALRAVQCATALHARLDKFQTTPDDPNGTVLRLHMGVGCGQLTSIHVGGVFHRWEYVVAGPPMEQIAVAEPLAMPGETVISPETVTLLGSLCRGTLVGDLDMTHRHKHPEDDWQKLYLRVDGVHERNIPNINRRLKLTEKHMHLLRRYIPAAVLPKLKHGFDGHLAELREVSVVFVNCKGVNLAATPDGDCTKAILSGHQLMLSIQKVIYQWEGSINKFLVDDKGLLVLCAFGLPPLKHGDDPKRAVIAARTLIEELRGQNITCSIGVTSGTAFCGVVGSPQRREYTVMGDIVNLAARLMAAAEDSQILVDERTRMLSDSYMQFKERPELKLKGKEKPERNFVPTESVTNEVSRSNGRILEARRKEKSFIHDVLKSDKNWNVVVMTGERGSGKSALVDFARNDASMLGFSVLRGNKGSKNSEEVNEHSAAMTQYALSQSQTPLQHLMAAGPHFAAFQGIFKTLVEKGAEFQSCTPLEWVERHLDSKYKEISALLNLVAPWLKIPFPPQPPKATGRSSREVPTKQSLHLIPFWELSDVQRSTCLKEMITQLVEEYAKDRATLILLHLQTGTSAHISVDPESWSLSLRLIKNCKQRPLHLPKLVMFIVTRPLVNCAPIEFIEIVQAAKEDDTFVQLRPLGRQGRLQYLRKALGVGDFPPLPAELTEYISDNAAGNPKHIDELVAQLHSEKAIEIKDGQVNVLTNLNNVPIPQKLIGTVVGMIDRMQARHQLIVKVASMYNYFSLGMLHQTFPYDQERYRLPHVLRDLVDSGVLREIRAPHIPPEVLAYHPEAKNCYCFQSKLLQRQANKSLLASNKKELEQNRHKMAMMNTIKRIIRIQQKTRHWLAVANRVGKPAQAASPSFRATRQSGGGSSADLIDS